MRSAVPSPQFDGGARDRQTPVNPDVDREYAVMSGATAFSELALEHPFSRRFFQCEADELRHALAPLSEIHPGFSPYIDLLAFRASNPEASAVILEERDIPEVSQHLAAAQRSVQELPTPDRLLDLNSSADQAALVALKRAENLGRLAEAMKIASPGLSEISQIMLDALESVDPNTVTEDFLSQATTPPERDRFLAWACPNELKNYIGLELRLVSRLIVECARWQELLREIYRRAPDETDPKEMMTVRFSQPFGADSISAATVYDALLSNSPTLEQWGTFSNQLDGHLNARIARIPATRAKADPR